MIKNWLHYYAAGAAVGGDPFDRSTVILLVDAGIVDSLNTESDGTGFTPADNQEVAMWANQDGPADDLRQVSFGSRPIYKANYITGLNEGVLLFDGEDDFMGSVFAGNDAARTYYIVVRRLALSGTLIDGLGQNTGRLYSNSGQLSVFAGASGASSSDAEDNDWHIIRVMISPDRSELRVDFGTNNVDADDQPEDMEGLTVGAYGGGVGCSNIAVAYIVVFDGETGSDLDADVMAYLGGRYAIL